MLITLNDLLNATEAFRNLTQKEMGIKLAYKIARITKALDAEYTIFNDARTKLIKEFGEHDENGELKVDEKGNINVQADKINDFTNEMNSLLQTTIEINIEPLLIDELDGLTLSPIQINALLPFMQE